MRFSSPWKRKVKKSPRRLSGVMDAMRITPDRSIRTPAARRGPPAWRTLEADGERSGRAAGGPGRSGPCAHSERRRRRARAGPEEDARGRGRGAWAGRALNRAADSPGRTPPRQSGGTRTRRTHAAAAAGTLGPRQRCGLPAPRWQPTPRPAATVRRTRAAAACRGRRRIRASSLRARAAWRRSEARRRRAAWRRAAWRRS